MTSSEIPISRRSHLSRKHSNDYCGQPQNARISSRIIVKLTPLVCFHNFIGAARKLLTLLQVCRAVEGVVSNIDEIIGDFERRFTQLRVEFLMGSTIQVAQTALLILEKAKNIGVCSRII